MCFATPSIPSAPAAAPNPAPKLTDPAVQDAAAAEQRRRAQMQGRQSTILTGGAGLVKPATTAPKTVLGA